MPPQQADAATATLLEAVSPSGVRLASGAIVAAAGLAAIAVPVVRLLFEPPLVDAPLLGTFAPALFGVAVLAGGLWIATSDLDGRVAGGVALWWFLGTGFGTFAALGLVGYQMAAGVDLVNVAIVISGLASIGGAGGLLVGRYDARSKRRRAELERERERLADEREKLVLLNRIVRHDIGNDLQIIAGVTDHLEDHVDESGREHLVRAQRTTEEAIQLTEQVRAFVASLGESESSDRRRISLARVLETQIENTRDVYRAATVAVDGEIPDVAVYADELLATVFHNLLTNAIEHNDRAQPYVAVTVERKDGRVAVAVKDDGPGIPESERERVHNVGSAEGARSDSGLGLYIVGMLVDRYEGSVTITDRDPRGTVVTVELPVAGDD